MPDPATQPLGLKFAEGEMVRRLREKDWSKTSIGPIEQWPDSLKTAVGICLNSRFPMFIWWGPDLLHIYNDAYIPTLGKRHPASLGHPAPQTWADVWPVVGPQVEGVMQRGESTWNDRVLLTMERNGYVEDTYHTWSYSPIPDGKGGVGGVFCACVEETQQVMMEHKASQLAEQRQLALDAAKLGWWHLDPLTGVSVVDERFAQIFGVDHGGSVLNDEMLARVERDDLPMVLEAVGAALDVKNPKPFSVEYRIHPDPKTTRWIEAHGAAEFAGEGAARRAISFVGTVADISDRRLADETMRLSEERLALSVDAAELGTFYCPAPFGKIIWNAKCCEHFWLPADAEVNFDRFYAILHPDDRERTRQAVDAATLAREPYDIEYRTVAPDGRTRWIRAKGRAYFDAAGQPTRFDGVTLDISEQKRIESDLRANEARFRSLADALPQLVWVAKADGTPAYLNKRWYEYTGLETGSIDPEYRARVLDPESHERVLAAWRTSLTTGTDFECEYRMRRHDGERRWFLGRAVAIRDDHGTIINWFGTGTDIDDQKIAEAKLRQSEAHFREMADTAPAMLWVTEPDGSCSFLSEGWYEFTGQTPEEGLGFGWAEAAHPDDFANARDAFIAANGAQSGYEVDFRLRRADGVYRWVIDSGRPRFAENGAFLGFIGCVIDIDDRKRAEEERAKLLQSERAARAEADHASRMKDEFLATLSHELRTPLNAILGWSQIIKRSADKTPDIAQGLDVIERNARAQAQIIEDLLDMSRIISGKVRLDVQRLDLSSIVASACETARPGADAKQIRLQAVIDPLSGVIISGDANRLQQILWNLISNAIKFTPKGGRVQVLLERVNSHVEVSVTDTGEGISADFLPFVFDRFRQADASTTRRYGGLGLGLSIVKQLVELHGGSIRATSPGLGLGASFVVALPLSAAHVQTGTPANREHPRVATAEPPAGCDDVQGIRALVVDDEADARALVRRLLEECGAVVSIAATADEAVMLVREQPYDVLISDIGMPGEDGHALIRRIRQLGGAALEMPAIALTAYARPEDRVKAIRAGFQLHMAKPIEPAELIAVVASVTKRK